MYRSAFLAYAFAVLLFPQLSFSKPDENNNAWDRSPTENQKDEESLPFDVPKKVIELDDPDTVPIEDSDSLDQAEVMVPLPQDAVQSPYLDQETQPLPNTGPDPRYQTPPDCPPDQYKCQKADPMQVHTRCIPMAWKCNARRDCELNDDELGCLTVTAPEDIGHNQSLPVDCAPNEHKCYGTGLNNIAARCVEQQRLCDGVNDCTYGDDEANCPPPRPSPSYRVPSISVTPEPVRGHASEPHYSPYPIYPSTTLPRLQPSFATAEVNCPQPTRSEEYIEQLEKRDRCFRSCMRSL